MTALTARPTRSHQPASGRLLAAAIVAAAGMIAFSTAFASWVVGSSHLGPTETANQANALIAGTPLLVAAGIAHLVVATILLNARGAVRTLAVGTTAVAGIAALVRAVILLTGLDPTGGPGAGHPTTQGVVLPLLAAAAYGFAVLAATASGRD